MIDPQKTPHATAVHPIHRNVLSTFEFVVRKLCTGHGCTQLSAIAAVRVRTVIAVDSTHQYTVVSYSSLPVLTPCDIRPGYVYHDTRAQQL